MIHRRMGWAHHEVGKVDIGRMDLTLRAAYASGLTIVDDARPPPHTPVLEGDAASGSRLSSGDPVGEAGGPSASYTSLEEGVGSQAPGVVCGTPRALPDWQGQLGTRTDDRSRGSSHLPRPPITAAGPPLHRVAKPSARGHPAERAGSPSTNLSALAPRVVEPEPWAPSAPLASARGASQRGMPEPSACFSVPRDDWRRQGCSEGSHRGTEAPPGRGWSAWKSWGESMASPAKASDNPGKGVAVPRPPTAPGALDALPERCRVVVVGGGASGLSAAACLRTRGEDDVVVLER